MRILALETSAVAASCCLCEDGKLIAQTFRNNGLTHSRTLLPMVAELLEGCDRTLEQVELLAVSAGPGSFTGLRIGVSTVKGLAWKDKKPVCAVSTLEGMAWNLGLRDGYICCAMDARRKQVYNALFLAREGHLERVTPDQAVALENLSNQLAQLNEPFTVTGDGARLCFDYMTGRGLPARMAPEHLVQQSAWGVAKAAEEMAARGEIVSAEALKPEYLRLSQAERERLEREKQSKA